MKVFLTICLTAMFIALFCIVSSFSTQVATLPPHSFKEYMAKWEGYRHTYYADAGGISVGIGHRLNAHVDGVEAYYTDEEIDTFFKADYWRALQAARSGVRDFDELPTQVQWATLSLIWTVGPTGFDRFVKFRSALSARDYSSAARELVRSKWAIQVGAERVRDHCGAILGKT